MSKKITVTLNDSELEVLEMIGSGLADFIPQANGKLSDENILVAGLIALGMGIWGGERSGKFCAADGLTYVTGGREDWMQDWRGKV